MSDNSKKKSDEEILFPEVKIGNITLKPWTFGKLFELSELLEKVLDKADEKGVIDAINSNEGFLSYTTLARLFTIASYEMLKIISITTDTDEDTIKSLPMQDGIQIAYTIYNQNKDSIKNALALASQQ